MLKIELAALMLKNTREGGEKQERGFELVLQ